MSDGDNPELTPKVTPEVPVTDDLLMDNVDGAISRGLEASGLIKDKSPEEVAKIVGQIAAGGAINILRQLGIVDPSEDSQTAAESSMGDLLAKYVKHDGKFDQEAREDYSSAVDEKAREKAKNAKDAYHDDLTPLLNRRGFMRDLQSVVTTGLSPEEIEEKGKKPMPAAFFVVDLNGLTKVNNEKGHNFGDKVIKGAAKVLSDSTRGDDIVARVGGDEFFILICEKGPDKGLIAGQRAGDPRDDDVLKSFSARIAAKTLGYIDQIGREEGIDLDDLELAVGGVEWDESKTFEELYEEADAKMYRDKKDKYEARGKTPRKSKKPNK